MTKTSSEDFTLWSAYPTCQGELAISLALDLRVAPIEQGPAEIPMTDRIATRLQPSPRTRLTTHEH